MWLSELVWSIYYTFLHHIYKWLIHKITGKCELMRIVYGTVQGAHRTYPVEFSLKNSKQLPLEQMLATSPVNVDDILNNIFTVKKIIPNRHPQFGPALKVCLYQICGCRELAVEVEALRRTPYSSGNPDHEVQLLELWQLLQPEVVLESRISKQWSDIGFQGDDPATDFRGMGLLGLKNLLYLASHHNESARKLLSHSHHPQFGYSFAIVGINLTHLTLQLMNEGLLRTHFYNSVFGRPTLDHFHQAYCFLFVEFDSFWIKSEPRDIMEFNRVREEFRVVMAKKLKDKATILQSSLQDGQSPKNDSSHIMNS